MKRLRAVNQESFDEGEVLGHAFFGPDGTLPVRRGKYTPVCLARIEQGGKFRKSRSGHGARPVSESNLGEGSRAGTA